MHHECQAQSFVLKITLLGSPLWLTTSNTISDPILHHRSEEGDYLN